MQDKFTFTLNHLKEQFNNRLEINTKEVLEVLNLNAATLSNRIKMGETYLLPKFRLSGTGKGQKSCGRYRWPIYDLAVFLTQDNQKAAS